jgi:cytochrome c oxidase assembly protein subunit 15
VPATAIARTTPRLRLRSAWARIESLGSLNAVLLANLAVQVMIVVSGGVVRLTGSGLGCPTFPQCVPGSYTPVVTQPQGFHKYIEFGNRMLTFEVTVFAIAALIRTIQHVRTEGGDRRLLWLGALPVVGVFAQALIGGISVLTKLNPTVVATHFLVSMCLITGSTLLLLAAVRFEDHPSPTAGTTDDAVVHAGIAARWLAVALALATVPVLVLGTVVTGSGPHSGDAEESHRFHYSIVTVAHLHSGAVWLYTALLLALIVTLWRTGGPARARRRALVLLTITLAQGVIGYIQYALGVPVALVAAHMLGASLLVLATTATVYSVLRRPVLVPAPSRPDQRSALLS